MTAGSGLGGVSGVSEVRAPESGAQRSGKVRRRIPVQFCWMRTAPGRRTAAAKAVEFKRLNRSAEALRHPEAREGARGSGIGKSVWCLRSTSG